MTREEAIQFLKGYLDEEVYSDKCRAAHDMAIKSLEQEPCCNCIEFKRYAKEIGFEIEQEPKSEWQKDNEILKAYSDGANGVLDEIRAEIDRQEKWLMSAGYNAYNVDIAFNSIRSVVKESEE